MNQSQFIPRAAPSVFPCVEIALDRPRVFQFFVAALRQFRAFHAIDPAKLDATIAKDVQLGLKLVGDLVWCGLPEGDRKELSREGCGSRITIQSLISVVASMKQPATPGVARN